MALYWPEARVAVVYREPAGDEDYPPDVLVISMRPNQVEDPAFAATVRDLVSERAAGGLRPEGAPAGGPGTEEERRALDAERRFERAFLGAEDECGEGEGEGDDGPLDLDDLLDGTFWGGCGACPDMGRPATVHVTIGRCGELLVGR